MLSLPKAAIAESFQTVAMGTGTILNVAAYLDCHISKPATSLSFSTLEIRTFNK
jgi:hypothetical protein